MLLKEFKAITKRDQVHYRQVEGSCVVWQPNELREEVIQLKAELTEERMVYCWIDWQAVKGKSRWHTAAKCPNKGKRRVAASRLKK